MDRNKNTKPAEQVQRLVALRKESVDRNRAKLSPEYFLAWSLSARRAWIEIIDYIIDYVNDAVALRKESVDRNSSAAKADSVSKVALRKESVDRNVISSQILGGDNLRRSPQGERG